MFLARQSLRLKVTLLSLGVFALVLASALAGAWFMHDRAARGLLDEHLEAIAFRTAARLQQTTAPPADLGAYQAADQRVSVLALRDASGAVLSAGWRVDTEALPPVPGGRQVDQATYRSVDGETAQALIGEAEPSRMVTYSFLMPNGELRFVDLARTRLDAPAVPALAYAAAIAAFVMTTLAFWFVAGIAVAPFSRMTEAARRVDPRHLDARIDITGRESEVGRLQAELNAALTRLEGGFRAQERFIANVAHDLKTPIALMLSESQVLHPHSARRNEIAQYRESVIAELQRLGGLVEGFLTLARARHGNALARAVPVAANDLVVEAVARCGGEAKKHDLLRAMLVNLISNAIRHSPQRRAVIVRLSCRREVLLFSVRDFGPGVPPEFTGRLFDPYVRASEKAGGTGLGLAIAKSVAKMHGGQIIIRNVEPGCVFFVRLNRRTMERRTRASRKRVQRAQKRSDRGEAHEITTVPRSSARRDHLTRSVVRSGP
ncbi:MAG: sensor histidine kinase [Planctomycetota bacterium]